MAEATVYLRTSLFTWSSGKDHVPAGVAAVQGDLVKIGDGGVRIGVTSWLDEKGRELESTPRTLFLPMSKVDHVDLQED